MSSCDASCSICCRRASCASATSVSSPTATAPRCRRCAVRCWAAQRERQLRRLNHLPKHHTHFGTAQSAVEPCTSSNGSPLRNFCFALHRNRTAVPHERLSVSPTSGRAPARMQILCLIPPESPACQGTQTPQPISENCCAAPSCLHAIGIYPTQTNPRPSPPAQTESKYIGFREGGDR